MGNFVGLDEILSRLNALPPDKAKEVIDLANQATKQMVWVANPGPQTEAYFSPADEVFYGGSAGGGKSDLIIGLALNEHEKSLILRRTNTEAEGLNIRIEEIVGNRDSFHSQKNTWDMNGKSIKIGGCQLEDDKQKYKGTPHDLIGFDEVSDFSQDQFNFITTWNRSVNLKQRCRVVAAGNPPTTPEGLWVLKRWAAWLDPSHPKPAKPGELRWYSVNDEGTEVEHTVKVPGARSRTFIPAVLSDNPDLSATNYGTLLDALPKELRDAYRDGKFDAGLRDKAFQCIPTDWVMQAMNRWSPNPPAGVPMCAIGLDVAQSLDMTVAAPRHDGWFAPLVKVPGKETPTGAKAAGFVLGIRRDEALVIVDMGGGYGGACYEWLTDNGVKVTGYKGAEAGMGRTVDGQLSFRNKRSKAYWQFREALDPGQPGGSPIMLPDGDRELIADLTAPTFKVGPNGIEVEAKESVVKRLGRSTDSGDAVVMSWSGGDKISNLEGGKWAKRGRNRQPKVVMSNRWGK